MLIIYTKKYNNLSPINITNTSKVFVFESVCGDITLFVKYVNETWLTPYKERFMVAWTNRFTLLENTTTNRYVDRDSLMSLLYIFMFR